MTQPPSPSPPNPWQSNPPAQAPLSSTVPPNLELTYQSMPEFRNAPTLVKLAAIFSLVSAGLSLIGGFYMFALTIFMTFIMKSSPPSPGGPPPPMMMGFFYIYYGVLGMCAFAVCVVKVIG